MSQFGTNVSPSPKPKTVRPFKYLDGSAGYCVYQDGKRIEKGRLDKDQTLQDIADKVGGTVEGGSK